MKRDDGGAAFPFPGNGKGPMELGHFPGYRGMSLRDYFAAAALQGMPELAGGGNMRWVVRAKRTAKRAYIMADAMLAERAK